MRAHSHAPKRTVPRDSDTVLRGQPKSPGILQLQQLAGNQAVISVLDGRTAERPSADLPMIQRISDLAEGQKEKAERYLNVALGEKNAGYTWAQRQGLLTAAEKTALSDLWRTKVGKKSTHGPTLTAAGRAVADELIRMLATTKDVVKYSNNFDAKHTTDDLKDNSGVTLGNLRDPKPTWSTVFDRTYFVGALKAAAAGKADGDDFVWEGDANTIGQGHMALAELKRSGYKKAWVGIFKFKVFYRIVTDAANRTRTLTAKHLETV